MRKLLEAALVVLDERGYHGARVDDIVKLAETSHGTFYLYFSNKEDLFEALITDVTEEMRDLAASLPPVSRTSAGYEDLVAWLGRFYDLYEHYHPVIRVWTEANARNVELARTGARVLRRFTDQLVRRIREASQVDVADPRAAALAMVSMVERATFYGVVHMVPVKRAALLHELATILHVGVFGGTRQDPVGSAAAGEALAQAGAAPAAGARPARGRGRQAAGDSTTASRRGRRSA